MTDISFTEAPADVPDYPDIPPAAGMLQCEQCGIHFEHSGRGRKPKKCPDCRATRTPSSGSSTRRSTADVKAALATLDSMYSAIAFGLLTVSPASASVWAAQIEQLQRTNELALSGDKNLCRAINRMGERTGKAMFFGAHIMAIAPVVVTLRSDLASRKPKAKPANTKPADQPKPPVFEQPPVNNSTPNMKFFE